MGSRQLMAVVAGTVSLMVLGMLTYGMLLAEFFAANAGSAVGVWKEEPVMWALGVGQLAWAVALVYLFGRVPGVSSFAAGAKLGALLGLFVGAWWDLSMFAAQNAMNLTAAVADIGLNAVMSGITGGIVAAILSRGSAKA
jgi:uncharacterized membrane protein